MGFYGYEGNTVPTITPCTADTQQISDLSPVTTWLGHQLGAQCPRAARGAAVCRAGRLGHRLPGLPI